MALTTANRNWSKGRVKLQTHNTELLIKRKAMHA